MEDRRKGVIRCCPGDLEDLEHNPGLCGRTGQDGKKITLRNQARAGTRQQDAAGSDDLHAEPVDITVCPMCTLDFFSTTGEFGRVEDHDVRLHTLARHHAQVVKYIDVLKRYFYRI